MMKLILLPWLQSGAGNPGGDPAAQTPPPQEHRPVLRGKGRDQRTQDIHGAGPGR